MNKTHTFLEEVGERMPSAYKHFLHQAFLSLDEFASQLADVLSCPVTIENLNHELVAYSQHGEGADAARISTIISRKVPDHLIQRFWKEGIMEALHASSEPVAIQNMQDVGLGPRVALSIRNQKGSVIGYIWVSETRRSLTLDEKQWLKRVATKASTLLQKEGRAGQNSSDMERLWRLLTGTFSESDIPPELHREGIRGCVLILDAIEEKKSAHFQRLLTEKRFLSIVDGARMIILVLGQDVIEEVTILVKAVSVSCVYACGNPTDMGAGLSRSYEQALRLLLLKERFTKQLETAIFYYESGPLRYIPAYEEESRASDCHPALSILLAYDHVHHTSLLQTLAIYVQEGGHMMRTAEKLHIHPNSLQYRLKRISELTDVQLKSSLERTGLLLDLHQQSWLHLWKTHK
ncbi:helix-turn-helix domain-containing protein [Bacillus sp. FSL W7-1360]